MIGSFQAGEGEVVLDDDLRFQCADTPELAQSLNVRFATYCEPARGNYAVSMLRAAARLCGAEDTLKLEPKAAPPGDVVH